MNDCHQSSCFRAKFARIVVCLGSAIAFALIIGTPALASDADSATRAPSFQIESPSAGASVDSPVAIQVLLHGATIGRPEDGLDHLHIAVDHGEAIPIYLMPVAPLKLAPGPHTLAVELAGPDHQPLTAPQVVSFTVKP